MKPTSKAEMTLLSAAACLTLAGAASAQSLIGDAYLANRFNDGDLFPGRSIVDMALLGPDAVGNWLRLVGYDVEHDTIEVKALTGSPFPQAGNLFEFSDLDLLGGDPRSQIIGAHVISAAGAAWGQINDSDISFTHDTVVIDGRALSDAAWARNDFVRVGLEFAPRASYTTGGLDALVSVPPSPFEYSVSSSVRDGPDSKETWPEFDVMGFDVEASSVELFARRDDGLAWPNGVSARFFLYKMIDPRFQVTGATVVKALGFGWDQIDDSDLGFSFHPEVGTTVLSINLAKIGGGPKDLNQSLLIALEQEVVGSLIGDGYVARLYLFGNPSPQESRQDTAREGGDMFGEWESTSAFRYNVEADEIVVWSAATSGSWASGVSFEFTDLDFTPEGIEIIGATVTSATGDGWDEINDTDLSFTADSVRIDASKIRSNTPALDQQVTVKLQLGVPRLPPLCPGDIADSTGFGPADGLIDFGDFFALSFLAGPCGPGTLNEACDGDLADGSGFGLPDGWVDFGDFFALSFLAGPCP